MPAPKCKVCEAKSETIRALELTIQALNEMVNLQRAVSAPGVIPLTAGNTHSTEYPPLKPVDGPPDFEDIADRLNNDPDLDPEVADRLLSELQVLNTEQS